MERPAGLVAYRWRPAGLVFGCPSPFRLPRWGMILSVRATQGRPGPLGGGLPWAIFGNAFSVEEDKEQGTKELFVRKGGRILVRLPWGLTFPRHLSHNHFLNGV